MGYGKRGRGRDGEDRRAKFGYGGFGV